MRKEHDLSEFYQVSLAPVTGEEEKEDGKNQADQPQVKEKAKAAKKQAAEGEHKAAKKPDVSKS